MKVYQELRLESLKSWRSFRRLCYSYKIKNYGFAGYLFKLTPLDIHSHNTRSSENITAYHCRSETFKHSFFTWTIVELNKLDIHLDLLGLNHLNENRFKHNFEDCIKRFVYLHSKS